MGKGRLISYVFFAFSSTLTSLRVIDIIMTYHANIVNDLTMTLGLAHRCYSIGKPVFLVSSNFQLHDFAAQKKCVFMGEGRAVKCIDNCKGTREHKRDDLLSALSAPHNNALIGTKGISQVMSINPTKTKWQFIHFILLQTPICSTFLTTLSFYLKIKKKSVFSCGSCGNPLCIQLFPSIHSGSRIDDSAAVKIAPKYATSC